MLSIFSTSLILQWSLLSLIIYLIISLIKWLQFKWNCLNCFERLSIPGPKPSFWFGNLPEYIQNPFVTLNKWSNKYGSYFGYFFGNRPILVINDRDAIYEILVQNGSKFPNRQKSDVELEPFQSSLLNQRDKAWKHARRILTPAFTAHKMSMETTRQAIDLSVKRMIESMEKKLSKNNSDELLLNITQHMNSVTLDVICRLAFNMNDTDVHEDHSSFRKMVVDFMQQSSDPTLRIIEYFPSLKNILHFLFYFFGNGKLLQTISQKLDNEISKYYQEKLRNHLEEKSVKKNNRKINILDFMIEQQELGNLNELQLIGNAVVILLAGYETTATGLSFTLYLLAKHPDWQEKLRKEILENFNDDYDYCQFDQYRSELLDRIWYESLRLYPPVISFITRQLETGIDEYHMKSLDINITKNMTILVPTWEVHHNEKYWPRPNEFDPNRDDLPIPGNKTINKNSAFQAFGSGPRNCIGGNLALSESRAVIVALLKHYRFDLIKDPKSERFTKIDSNTGLIKLRCPTVIIHPEKDIWLRVTKIC